MQISVKKFRSFAAGDIGAVVGLKDPATGDTICDEQHPILLEKIDIPAPVISASVEPNAKAEYDKMVVGLRKLCRKIPRFSLVMIKKLQQTVVRGMGELHLEIILDRLKREHKVEVTQGKMQVAYKETIQKPAESEGKFIRQTGGHGQYGHVWLTVEPLPRGKGYEFESKIVGGTVPTGIYSCDTKGT